MSKCDAPPESFWISSGRVSLSQLSYPPASYLQEPSLAAPAFSSCVPVAVLSMEHCLSLSFGIFDTGCRSGLYKPTDTKTRSPRSLMVLLAVASNSDSPGQWGGWACELGAAVMAAVHLRIPARS